MPVGAFISAAGSIGGALISSGSANKAANAQTKSAEAALALQKQIFDTTRADLSPWTMVGQSALFQLSDALGVSRPVTMPNLGVLQSPTAGFMGSPPVSSGGASTAAPTTGSGLIAQYAGFGLPGLIAQYAKQQAAQPPTGGTTTATPPTMTQGTGFQTSPGYQFAFNQGVKAVDAGAATQGLLGSGARLKALTEFGQGMANQEYWNYLNQLGNLMSAGQNAAAQTGTFGANYANSASNLFGAKGSAQAANAVAQGNIWGETIGNLAPLFGNWAAGNMGSAGASSGTQGYWTPPYNMNWG